jgi:predicted acylesterase/phospholipase RssA
MGQVQSDLAKQREGAPQKKGSEPTVDTAGGGGGKAAGGDLSSVEADQLDFTRLFADPRARAAVSEVENLVFEGGGVVGCAYAGVVEVLEGLGARKHVRRVAGASAGSMAAMAFALGFSAEEFRDFFVDELDFSALMDGNVISDFRHLLQDFGWHPGKHLHSVLEDLVDRKLRAAASKTRKRGARPVKKGEFSRATFRQLAELLPDSPGLFVLASNLTTEKLHVYSTEATPDVVIADAVRMSMGIPLFFVPVREPAFGDVMVDGGLFDNFPIQMFDDPKYMSAEQLQHDLGASRELNAERRAARRRALNKVSTKRLLIDYDDPDDLGASASKSHSASSSELSEDDVPMRTIHRVTTAEERLQHARGESLSHNVTVFNSRTLGIRLDSPEEIAVFRDERRTEINDIQCLTGFARGLIEALLLNNARNMSKLDRARTIWIPNLGVSPIDFRLKRDVKLQLIESGRRSVAWRVSQWARSGRFDDAVGSTSNESSTMSDSEVVEVDDVEDPVGHRHWWRQNWKILLGISGSHWRRVGENDIDLTIRFRTLALLATICFLLAVGAGGILTLTLSDYEADRDYIMRVFGRWNPCVFFDHFPANSVALPIAALFCVVMSVWIFGLLAVSVLIGDPTLALGSTVASMIHLFSVLNMPNVFAANLYEHGYHEADEDITSDDVARVVIHTAFYGLLLFCSGINSINLLNVMRRAGGKVHVSAWLPAASLVILLFQGLYYFLFVLQGKVDISPNTAVQYAMVWIQDAAAVRSYAWVPLLVMPYLPPTEMGIRVTFRTFRDLPGGLHLHNDHTDPDALSTSWSRLRPARVFSVAFRLLAAGLVLTYAMTDPLSNSGATSALASAFREVPFRYFFVPLWMAIMLLVLVSVTATVAQRQLIGVGYVKFVVVAALSLMLAMLLSLEIIIPQIESTGAFLAILIFAMNLWFASHVEPRLSWSRSSRLVVYCVIFTTLALLSVFLRDSTWAIIFNAGFVVCLCLFEFFFAATTRPLFWRFEALGVSHFDSRNPLHSR